MFSKGGISFISSPHRLIFSVSWQVVQSDHPSPSSAQVISASLRCLHVLDTLLDSCHIALSHKHEQSKCQHCSSTDDGVVVLDLDGRFRLGSGSSVREWSSRGRVVGGRRHFCRARNPFLHHLPDLINSNIVDNKASDLQWSRNVRPLKWLGGQSSGA
jgi:hypothetical protein